MKVPPSYTHRRCRRLLHHEAATAWQSSAAFTTAIAAVAKRGSSYTLVGGLEHSLFFPILGIVTLTDFHIFQRG